MNSIIGKCIVSLTILLMSNLCYGQIIGADTLYQVQIGTYHQSVDFGQFDDIAHLGQLHVTSIQDNHQHLDTITTVYLGIYIGKRAVDNVIDSLNVLGYLDASIERNGNYLKTLEVTHAVQLEALDDLDFSAYAQSSEVFYIAYEGRQYKYFSLVYSPQAILENQLDVHISRFQKRGFFPFIRVFR